MGKGQSEGVGVILWNGLNGYTPVDPGVTVKFTLSTGDEISVGINDDGSGLFVRSLFGSLMIRPVTGNSVGLGTTLELDDTKGRLLK